jgi:flagellar assembly factor FliW
MPQCETKYFGELGYYSQSIIEFPEGLPGFEGERTFILIDRPDLKPLVFVQSLVTPGLCFLTLPVLVAARDYRLEMTEANRRSLGLPDKPAIGRDVACFAIVNLRETGTFVNLLAPLVIELKTRRALQAIVESGYSHEHPLGASLPETAAVPEEAGITAGN